MCANPYLSGRRGVTRKTFQAGTHRLIPPAETVQRLRPWLAAMGITRLANITGLDSIGIPAAVACRPNSRSVAVANGKGLDLAAAEASALMEAVEGYHAERINLPLKLGSFADLRSSHRLVDVEALPRRTTSPYHRDFPLLWVEGYDLLQEEPIWLPYEMVHTNYTLPLPQGSGCFILSSNGLASGNHPLEAISHAICEVVERDATTLWEVSDSIARAQTRLALDSVGDPACRSLLEKYDRAGVGVAVYDTTSDVRLPAFLCTIEESAGSALGGIGGADGMGCHPVREIALLRALTEAAQTRVAIIAGSRDDIFAEDYEHLQYSDSVLSRRARIRPTGPARKLRQIPTLEVDTFDEDVGWELERLRSVGVDRVIVVDLSPAEPHVAVVRVVIPGLEYSLSSPNYVLGARARARLGRAT